ncbi:3-oxoacyl-[acyl-carrier-protein] reductase [Enterococcus cecorum]|uniref:3-oxoacyl-[acyl-carrier-protein] reductase n=1 Tax=Enterococcus cecorum TaxID=44008 RepID=A0AAW9JR32_9ENTE|nr:3-oxoacyl-[acyl-carrier-protein] reductase [Enterococcus cecorum]MDZ5503480.1 3-oxoacyl-[acyl-carrier-protein] reductase [Enterococcus cecorum]MDZ5530911.1 3-oxoacyl-[acyl-carrier-protein] reductase [Enterococcus cecorum]MDZ5544249.1 3-oxoacyl-[acyl-carrier-protein] reductase [Enterococcus cecorum]MDZ5548675.1 3-oxoacyl-[acyl-carrier-protein] reductase [Enterococcus cecorum]MDZ5551188.1 3-oxoacyl-[acyl-carrier-protein] reductase [Enterococcus cecorum]
MELKGQTAFITGSTRGIGLAIAKAFAKQGVHIILNGRRPVSEALIAEIKALGVNCIGISGDISNSEEVKEMVKKANEFAPVTILVNNAGITNDKLLLRMNEQDFEQVLKVNLTGSFNMTQQLLKGMLKQRKGTIINISSVSGLMGNVGQANYAASKAGLIGFTKTVAREIAPRKITCNAIAPGFIETDMTSELSDKIREEMTKNIPLQHFGQVEDIANTAVFLAKSPYITGQVINVDGGLVMNG